MKGADFAVNRFIGFKYFKGIPSDIDGIRLDQNSNFIFYEVKEKDLSKSEPVGFGIDVQRLDDCLALAKRFGVEYRYVVRHVNNQTDREFVDWRVITFDKFNELTDRNNIKEGGTGMNTAGIGDNPTVLVSLEHFAPVS